MIPRSERAETFLAGFTCSSTRHPAVCRFVWSGSAWTFVGASRQRPGSTIPASDAAQTHNGDFGIAGDYSGCPSCGSDSYVRCGSCHRLGCYDLSWPEFTCPSCGNGGPVTIGIDSVSAMSGS